MKTPRRSRWMVPVAILGILVCSCGRVSAMSPSDTLREFFRQAVAVVDDPRTETHPQEALRKIRKIADTVFDVREAAPAAQDMTSRRVKYKNYVDEQAKRKNTTKARVRSKVEHAFRILKRTFGFTKVRYPGLSKNHQWLCAAFALVNLYQHRNRLAPQRA